MNLFRFFRKRSKFETPQRVELLRIGADIYLNNRKIIFALDFENPPKIDPNFRNVDWLMGWAKIGMIKSGYNVAHFSSRHISEFENDARAS